jgi:hypothetical protein
MTMRRTKSLEGNPSKERYSDSQNPIYVRKLFASLSAPDFEDGRTSDTVQLGLRELVRYASIVMER